MTAEQALIRIYQQSAVRLRRQIRAALESGQIGTAVYRRRQLDAINAELRQLGQRTRRLSIDLAREAYARGAIATDASRAAAGRQATRGFELTGNVHARATTLLAQNTATRIADAQQLVGRRVEDAFRAAALDEVAIGAASGAERRLVSTALERRLIEERVTDSLTGFIDRAGRRWQLDVYTRMVARTTTREAMTAATANRLDELGADLVTISDHGTTTPLCQEFEGNTYSMTGRTAGYDVLPESPPFHPNCLHHLTPADGILDVYLETLENTPTDELDRVLGLAGTLR